MKKLKTITSHVGVSRWLAEVAEEPVGYLPRQAVAAIPSPYAYSPTKPVYAWNGKNVVWFETRHKYYEVFEVPAEMTVYATEAEAEHVFINSRAAPW